MKYMKQFAIILAVTCVGEFLNHLLPLPVPASIYGLILMLILLITKIVKIEHVDETGTFLVDIMPMMFIPAGVGLMTAWDALHPIIIPVLSITVISTVLVMAVTGKVTDFLVLAHPGKKDPQKLVKEELAEEESEEETEEILWEDARYAEDSDSDAPDKTDTSAEEKQ